MSLLTLQPASQEPIKQGREIGLYLFGRHNILGCEGHAISRFPLRLSASSFALTASTVFHALK